ncbi:tripartite motif-containing protein 44 isoform X2 [Mirounga leonina]|uniref:tripartite motif-containing protein 44 isoform X2 n=1 Tax=Mirounga leonina TaxID=9715 RepID=UPI00156C31C0|nr:tripartite motif-containing protein 44 isoform X2 [Mirounga leonina]
MASGAGAAFEELPHDGTCDECEPDEAPGAEEVCRECAFCYCHRHAEAHRQKFPSHHLAQYVHGAAQAWTAGAPGQGDAKEEAEAKVENERDLESEVGEESESEEDSESEEESETEEESEDESEDESEEDSEEEMEDEQESEAEEDNQEGESEAEGETEAESEFDPEIEMEAERVAKRKCPDHGLDLSTYCQEDKQLICVLCPVIGTHQGHQLSTLDEAFEELRSKDSGGLKAAMIELVERLKFKSSDPKVTRDQMKVFIQQEFKKVQKVIADEEQKALHLVDIQEAMATAHVTEILADIQSHMDRLMTQMAQAKEQLDTSNESAEPKAEGDEEGPRKVRLSTRNTAQRRRSCESCSEGRERSISQLSLAARRFLVSSLPETEVEMELARKMPKVERTRTSLPRQRCQ